MRMIRIISDGVPVDVYDDMDKSLEEATKYVQDIMKNDKVVTLIGKNSSAVVRPSSVSAINIIDTPERPKKELQQMEAKPSKNEEQKNEHIDMITDVGEW